jgi:predicted phosphodiesterase
VFERRKIDHAECVAYRSRETRGVRLVIASDTHQRHLEFELPDGDVFIHAGDFTMSGSLGKIEAFGKWIRALPHARKIVIAGNHDQAFEHFPVHARKALGDGRDGLTYLQDAGLTIDDVAFWGSPWQPAFMDWAFNLPRGVPLARKWNLIPERTDVLITHGPPMGILDTVNNENLGCADLRDRVQHVRPKLHAFGHIHEGSGIEVLDGITFVNASICDGDYRVTNPARVVDI